MALHVSHLSGAGNNFLIVDGVRHKIEAPKLSDLACQLCQHYGADGLVVLEEHSDPAQVPHSHPCSQPIAIVSQKNTVHDASSLQESASQESASQKSTSQESASQESTSQESASQESAENMAPVLWRFYNQDGSTASMCGNAARCVAYYMWHLYGCARCVLQRPNLMHHKPPLLYAKRVPQELEPYFYRVQMPPIQAAKWNQVLDVPQDILPIGSRFRDFAPTCFDTASDAKKSNARRGDLKRDGAKRDDAKRDDAMSEKAGYVRVAYSFLNTGVPHVVVHTGASRSIEHPYYEDLYAAIDERHWSLYQPLAQWIQKHSRFAAEGTNVSFYFSQSDRALQAVTFERGLSGFSRACGTGAIACARAHQHRLTDESYCVAEPMAPTPDSRDDQLVWMPGGKLHVEFKQGAPYLEGPVTDQGSYTYEASLF